MSTVKLTREQAGNRVFEALCEGEWTIAEGCATTGLTRSQWHTGLAYIRDVLAEEHVQPITYDASNHRYALAMFEHDAPLVDKYIITRIKTFAIQLARLRNGTFVPAKMKFQTPGTPKFKRVDDSLSRLFTDLANVLEDMGEEMPRRIREMMDKHAATAARHAA